MKLLTTVSLLVAAFLASGYGAVFCEQVRVSSVFLQGGCKTGEELLRPG